MSADPIPSPTTVFVSGLGCLSAAGPNLPTAMARLASRPAGPHSGPRFPTDHPQPFPVFLLPDLLGRPGMLRSSAMVLQVAEEALANAGIDRPYLRQMRVGVCLGTTGGCSMDDARFYEGYRAGETPDLTVISRFIDRDPAAELSRHWGLDGPAMCILDACCSGTDAIGIGAAWIREGRCDLVLAGGTDEVTRITYDGFASLLVASTRACRPFSQDRDGLNLGEGAGMVLLESARSLTARGGLARAELCGFGISADAYHPTAPHPGGRGLRRALAQALAQAGATPSDLAFVNAHGTGTIDNDRIEGQVLSEVLTGVPFVSTKGATGHTLGAAGAIEAAFTVATLESQHLCPSPGLTVPDPGLPASNRHPYPISTGLGLSQSLAFGGANSALIFSLPGASRPFLQGSAPRPWAIEGLGAIGPFGSGITTLTSALRTGPVLPSPTPAGPGGRMVSALRAPRDAAAAHLTPKALRRTDRFSQLALQAAAEALADAGLGPEDRQEVGIVVATGYGPTGSTTAFLDSILDDGDACASPTRFVRSVQNAAAADIALHLGCTGPAITVSRFALSVPAALVVAGNLLAEGRCQRVLVVGVDEYDPLIGHCYQRMFGDHHAGPILPLDFDRQTACPGEGASALVLGSGEGRVRAWLDEVGLGATPPPANGGTLLLAADGHQACGRHYRGLAGIPGATAWADRWGSLPTGAGFLLVGAALDPTPTWHVRAADSHAGWGWATIRKEP